MAAKKKAATVAQLLAEIRALRREVKAWKSYVISLGTSVADIRCHVIRTTKVDPVRAKR